MLCSLLRRKCPKRVDRRDAGIFASDWRQGQILAASIDTDTPRIALPASVEGQIETASKPYTAAVFFHLKATELLKLHCA